MSNYFNRRMHKASNNITDPRQWLLDLESSCKYGKGDLVLQDIKGDVVPLDFTCEIERITAIKFFNVSTLVNIPHCFLELFNLEHVVFESCRNLEEANNIPCSVTTLEIYECASLKALGKIPPSLKRLSIKTKLNSEMTDYINSLQNFQVSNLETLTIFNNIPFQITLPKYFNSNINVVYHNIIFMADATDANITARAILVPNLNATNASPKITEVEFTSTEDFVNKLAQIRLLAMDINYDGGSISNITFEKPPIVRFININTRRVVITLPTYYPDVKSFNAARDTMNSFKKDTGLEVGVYSERGRYFLEVRINEDRLLKANNAQQRVANDQLIKFVSSGLVLGIANLVKNNKLDILSDLVNDANNKLNYLL